MEFQSGNKQRFGKKYKIPVVFVPGIMGSRLKIYLSSDTISWEPDHPVTSVAENFGKMSAQTKRNRLDPANKTEFPKDLSLATDGQLTKAAPPQLEVPYQEMGFGGGAIDVDVVHEFRSEVCNHLIAKGWNEVSWDFYGDFLVNLQAHAFQGAHCPVYAVGYDWRGSNSKSAQRLHDRIQDIVEEENAAQVVIITHSMGGLVARSYVDQYGEEKVQSIIHITQPTYGAPVLYRRLRTGALTQEQQALLGSYGGFLDLLWSVKVKGKQTSPESAATIIGVMDGALELLPTASYRMKRTKQYSSWLSWPEWWLDGEQPPQDVCSLYHQSTDRLGIIPPDFEFREDLEKRISAATEFQNAIDEVFHSNTYWICSSGVNTDVAIRIEQLQTREVMTANRYGKGIERREIVPHEGPGEPHDFTDQGLRVIQYVSEKGDGTVPLDSQLGYEMTGAHEPEGAALATDVEHDQACNNDDVQQQVFDWIQTMIRDHAKQCAP